MIFSLFLVFLAVFLTGISQILLKIGSIHKNNREETILTSYLNPPIVTAYGLLFLVTIINVIALKEISLKMAYSIASLTFMLVIILSWKFLGERISKKTILGGILLILGVVIFNS